MGFCFTVASMFIYPFPTIAEYVKWNVIIRKEKSRVRNAAGAQNDGTVDMQEGKMPPL